MTNGMVKDTANAMFLHKRLEQQDYRTKPHLECSRAQALGTKQRSALEILSIAHHQQANKLNDFQHKLLLASPDLCT